MPEKPSYEELERRLLESERLRKENNAIFELSPDIIGIGNLDGFFIKVNSAFEKLTGYTKEELYERPFLSFIHEKDVERTCNALDELQKGKQFLNIENRYKCKNGSYKWIEWYVFASILENRFHAVGRDFTDRKKTEIALIESESKYRSVVENTPLLLCSYLPDGKITFVNQAYCSYLDRGIQELVGRHFLFLIPEEDRQMIMDNIHALTVDSPIQSHEQKVIVPGGEIRWQRWIDRAIFNEQGKAVHFQSVGQDVTEQKRNERVIEEFFEQPMNIHVIADFDGVIYRVNNGCHNILGFNKNELQTKFFFDYVHPDDLALTKKEMEKLGNGQTTFYFENRYRHKNGSYRLLAWSAIASLEDQLVYAVASDITECRQAETSFQKSTEELNHILNTAMDGFCLFDHAGHFIKVNETYCQMSGYNEQELLSMSIVDMEGLKTGEEVTKQVEKILELGENRFESLLRRKDGSLIDVELSVQYSERDGGRLIAFVRDITKQKKARKDVWESREKFRSLVELTSDWIWEVDRNGTYTYSSPQIKRLLGYQPQDLVGKMTPFDLMSADEAKKISALFKDIIASNKAFNNMENINIHKDGHPVVIETGGCPFFDEDGNLVGYRGVDRDITERKRMEEMMLQSAKMLSVGGLAAGMAHEINNPLAAMLQTAQVLSQRLKADPNIPANLKAAEAAGTTMESIEQFMEDRGIQKMIGAITESGQRISEIVINMLSFARKEGPVVSTHHLDKILDKAIELAATDYDFKGIKIIREYDENLSAIPCQAGRIQQVLLNILTNGAQAMHTAKTANPRFILRIRKEKSPDMIRIEIEDNGPGMDEKNRSKVFDPFFTTKPIGIGTGLGLSISYFIITENHNGMIDVISEPGEGANFIIRLPVHSPPGVILQRGR